MNLRHSQQRWETFATLGFAGVFFSFMVLYATASIADPDFWWHLKSGEYMVHTRGLLQYDPFNFTGDGVGSNIEAVILKGYWLWQLTAYGLYSLFGFYGIFLLNLLTIGAMAGVAFFQMRRQRVETALVVILLTLGFSLVRALYALERPQVVSFLFAAILLVLIDRGREGGKFSWTLPLLMLVWANLHGGFVVGDIILLAFLAGSVIEYRQDLPRLRHILLWVGIAIGASLINPNGAIVFGELIKFSSSTITEFQSTWVRFTHGSRYVTILWLLIVLYGAGLWISRRFYWPELVVAIFLAFFSVAYVRNVGFFAVAMLPLIGNHWHQGFCRWQWRLPAFVSLLVLASCSLFLFWLSCNLWQDRQRAWPVNWPVKAIYPDDAINFLHKSGFQGRIFNSYEYGGYLLWRLPPRLKIFIDGRGLDPQVFGDYEKLTAASAAWVDGRREYEALLDSYGINYIIQPIYDSNGNIQPLMMNLLNKPEWYPVYLDGYAYIMVRQTEENRNIINPYLMDKNAFKSRLLQIINYICQKSPGWVNCQIARAGMLIYLARYDEAKTQIEAIAAIAPHNLALLNLQREMASLQKKRVHQ